MEIADLLSEQRVRCGAAGVKSKKRALEALARQLTPDEDAETTRHVFEGLTLRERLGSTGLGRGVALPHSRSPDIEQPQAALIKLEEPIDFEAVDQQPVDLLFALIVPEHSNDHHLRILSQLAEMFRDDGLCARLRGCQSDADLYHTIAGWQAAPDHS